MQEAYHGKKHKKIARHIGESKKKAEQTLAIRKAEILQGRFQWQGKRAPVNFRELVDKEYLPYLEDKKRPSAYSRDTILISHPYDCFRKQDLSGITPESIEKHI